MCKQNFLQVVERLREHVNDDLACDLMDKLLTLDPSRRIDSDTALNHDFFWTDPMPSDLGPMLAKHSQSMFEYFTPRRRAYLKNPLQANGGPSKPSTSKVTDNGCEDWLCKSEQLLVFPGYYCCKYV